MRALAQRLTTPYGPRAGPTRAICRATAALTIAAGLIHVSAAVQHSDLPTMMIGFEVVAILQVGLGAVLVLGLPNRGVLAAGIALMASAVGLWLLSRTVGLGLLVEGAHREPIGFKDGVTVLFELLAIAGLAVLLEPSPARRAVPARWLVTPRLGVGAAVACALFVPALMAGGHRHVTSHVASLHGAGGDAAHAGAGHSGSVRGGSDHSRGHADRHRFGRHPGDAGDHSGHGDGAPPVHGAHGPEPALAHSHASAAGLAPVHDHALASSPGVAGPSHDHVDGGASTGTGTDHGTHPPDHSPGAGYGDSPEQPAPPPSEPTPVLGDVSEEVDKLVP